MDRDHREQELMIIRKSRRSFLLEYFCSALLLVLLTADYWKGIQLPVYFTYAIMAFVAFLILSAELARLTHRCIVTSTKLVIIDGLIRQSKKHIYIEAISDIDVKQSTLQRILNYGTIHIKSMSGEGCLEIKDVADPEEVMTEIEDIIEKYKNDSNIHQKSAKR